MKYVRTEHSVYEHDDVSWFDIIRQADTIEELCDEFVVMREGTKPHTADVPYFKIRMDSKYISEKGYEIRGAIWTDEGLIYVAEMNDKGELELL